MSNLAYLAQCLVHRKLSTNVQIFLLDSLDIFTIINIIILVQSGTFLIIREQWLLY